MQRGQAPCGELNEKMRGSSSGSETPCSGQAKFSEKRSDSLAVDDVDADQTLGERRRPSRPTASGAAAGRASCTSRSTTTSIVCLNFLSRTISSSSRRCSPSTLTRVKPSRAELLEHVLELALAVAHDGRVDREPRPLGQRRGSARRSGRGSAPRSAGRRPGSAAGRRARRAAAGSRRSRSPCRPSSAGCARSSSGRSRSPARARRSSRRRASPSSAGTGARRPRATRRSAAGPRRRSCRRPGTTCRSPRGPVMQMSAFRGSRTVTSLRLCSRAPWTISSSMGIRPSYRACLDRTSVRVEVAAQMPQQKGGVTGNRRFPASGSREARSKHGRGGSRDMLFHRGFHRVALGDRRSARRR